VVVEAEVKEEQGRPLIGVHGEVWSKNNLTEPTLLEMSGYAVIGKVFFLTNAPGASEDTAV
jgi:hypothetical protein